MVQTYKFPEQIKKLYLCTSYIAICNLSLLTVAQFNTFAHRDTSPIHQRSSSCPTSNYSDPGVSVISKGCEFFEGCNFFFGTLWKCFEKYHYNLFISLDGAEERDYRHSKSWFRWFPETAENFEFSGERISEKAKTVNSPKLLIYALLLQNFIVVIYAPFPQIFLGLKSRLRRFLRL